LTQIVADRDTFFAFLQERWPRFVRRWLAKRNKLSSLVLSRLLPNQR
jgi:hypothetical protein